MPSTHYSEAALARRREKFAGAAAFPGRLRAWSETVGRTVAGTVPCEGGAVLLFSDGSFLPAGSLPDGQDTLLAAITAAREFLAQHHPEALRELDARVEAEREAMRLARMEKVVGAVETNLPRIPELGPALRALLDEK